MTKHGGAKIWGSIWWIRWGTYSMNTNIKNQEQQTSNAQSEMQVRIYLSKIAETYLWWLMSSVSPQLVDASMAPNANMRHCISCFTSNYDRPQWHTDHWYTCKRARKAVWGLRVEKPSQLALVFKYFRKFMGQALLGHFLRLGGSTNRLQSI